MSEGPPKPIALESEEVLSEQEQYELEQAALFMDDYPPKEFLQFGAEGCAEKIAEFEGLCADFEHTHDLDALRAVEASTIEEARANEVRQAARADLPPIVALRELLEKQELVPTEVFQELHARYAIIQAAIGSLDLNIGKMDHSIRE
jgi:hypothetical protein